MGVTQSHCREKGKDFDSWSPETLALEPWPRIIESWKLGLLGAWNPGLELRPIHLDSSNPRTLDF